MSLSAKATDVTKLQPREVQEMMETGAKYIDVRTPKEFESGHVAGAINIPYMLPAFSGLKLNTSFVEDVEKSVHKNDSIVVACASGKRQAGAATALVAAGYENVVELEGGFSTWLLHRLPVSTE